MKPADIVSKRSPPVLVVLGALCMAAAAEAQINWHAPRAAGRVWEDKIDENNRQARNRTPEQRAEAEAADAAWNAPLSIGDIEYTLARHKADYERRLRLGKSFADEWLDRTARMDRFKREGSGAVRQSPDTQASPAKVTACSADALPAAQRARMQREYSSRAEHDGVAAADDWAKMQGLQFYQRLVSEGKC